MNWWVATGFTAGGWLGMLLTYHAGLWGPKYRERMRRKALGIHKGG
jgi:hypothetical protein